jgi:hypothetical protein
MLSQLPSRYTFQLLQGQGHAEWSRTGQLQSFTWPIKDNIPITFPIATHSAYKYDRPKQYWTHKHAQYQRFGRPLM